MRATILLLIFSVFLFDSCKNNSDDLAGKFANLPETVEKPWCYYYWINDDISKEGITKDLLAMKKAGIGAALIGNINPEGKNGKVPLFSEEWWEVMVHAVNEGHRIGIDIGVFNCPGWSQSGGPWINEKKAMQYITWTETKVKGPQKVSIQLPDNGNSFQDIRVIAFPTIQKKKSLYQSDKVEIASIPSISSIRNLADGDTKTFASFNTEVDTYNINFTFSKPIETNSILLYPAKPFMADCKLYVIINGIEKPIRNFHFDRSNFATKVGPMVDAPLALSLPGIKASAFRLKISNIKTNSVSPGFSEIVLSENAVLEKYVEKQLAKMHPTPLPEWNSYSWDEQPYTVQADLMVKEDNILDISENMEEDGRLNWNVPDGEWTILRFGTLPTGVKNHPASPRGLGFEVDKMNSEEVVFHFENFIGELLKRIPEESKSALKYTIIDSYEVGSQNWTNGYREEFMNKYDYDPIPYLPVLTGRIVGSVTESERFLWDLRRAVASDIAYEYVGELKKISNKNNMKLWLENYGHWGYPSEFLMYGGQSDLVSGEFWNEGSLGNIECKAASSAAHIYGKPMVSAEAFTSSGKTYLRHSAILKRRGDWSFTEGINHFVYHVYIHQPDDNRIPGINAWFGTEFNRHNTWFNYALSWIDYVRRCQLLLQQGTYSADVCYFIGEDAPIMTGCRTPELPQGYSYDYINAEVILNRLTVKDGKFVLPDGMSYQLMVLPPLKTMRPEVLRKIKELVNQGGKILGFQPEHSPSLMNYPACDEEIREIVSQLWGKAAKQDEAQNAYGKGIVFKGMTIEKVFHKINIEKDVSFNESLPILWTHRSSPDKEIYFLTNQSDLPQQFNASFRVKELVPQLWDPITGEIRLLNDYTCYGGQTTLPLKMNALQSYFIVFAKQNTKTVESGYNENFPKRETLLSLQKNWEVDFKNKKIGPVTSVLFEELKDWTLSQDSSIRYYSGEAVYHTTFNLEKLPSHENVFLNLGKVGVMARVKLNGQELGGVWIAPYLINTKGYLKQGQNILEIELVNLWRNRMILDKTLPYSQKYTYTSTEDIKEGEHLQSSGLIGPVTLETIEK